MAESEVLHSLREDWLNEMNRAEVAEARAEAAEEALRHIARIEGRKAGRIARAYFDAQLQPGDAVVYPQPPPHHGPDTHAAYRLPGALAGREETTQTEEDA